MAFNFNNFLQKGSEAAELVINNKREVSEVISEMIISLTQFLDIGLELTEEIEYEDESEAFSPTQLAILAFRDITSRKPTGFTKISIKSDNDKIKDRCYLFRLKRSPEGYPITVAKDGVHMVAENQSEFASAIGDVLSDAQTHIKLNQFVRKIKNTLQK